MNSRIFGTKIQRKFQLQNSIKLNFGVIDGVSLGTRMKVWLYVAKTVITVKMKLEAVLTTEACRVVSESCKALLKLRSIKMLLSTKPHTSKLCRNWKKNKKKEKTSEFFVLNLYFGA